eukprot:GSChrysophyteH1.ASY1.ANO1.2014.1 assembled CDS
MGASTQEVKPTEELTRIGRGRLQVPAAMQRDLDEVMYELAVDTFRSLPGLNRGERGAKEQVLMNTMLEYLADPTRCQFAAADTSMKTLAVDACLKRAFRDVLTSDSKRVDGRSFEEVRKITANTDVLPVVHGSSFFQRGDTHVLSTVTLGSARAGSRGASSGGVSPAEEPKSFVLHYDFPHYCHGALAEKAVRAVMPSVESFPYSVRVFAECTSSSGVPISSLVAGASIGAVVPKGPDGKNIFEKSILLTDLLGTEDYYGAMDFKIAGTMKGITALQLDMKVEGMPLDLLAAALARAETARAQILESMEKACPGPRATLKATAPGAAIVNVDTTIDGSAYIFGQNAQAVDEARMLVQDIVTEVSTGDKLTAEVVDIRDFGAMVKVTRAQEALLHISELSHDKEITQRPVSEVLRIGQHLDVEVLSVDTAIGAVRVSRKKLLNSDTKDPLLDSPVVVQEKRFKELPSFPTTPPRKYNQDYFKDKVVSNEDITKALKSQGEVQTGTSQRGKEGNSPPSKKKTGNNSQPARKNNKANSTNNKKNLKDMNIANKRGTLKSQKTIAKPSVNVPPEKRAGEKNSGIDGNAQQPGLFSKLLGMIGFKSGPDTPKKLNSKSSTQAFSEAPAVTVRADLMKRKATRKSSRPVARKGEIKSKL